MASLFNKDSGPRPTPGPYARERIEDEVAHLRHKKSVRYAGEKPRGTATAWTITLLIVVLLWLYFMDVPLHAYYRREAVRVYLYLHHYGSEKKAVELLGSGLFTPGEIELLNQRFGSYQNYYPGPLEGAKAADSILDYLHGSAHLQEGDYEALDWVGKLRYQLFVRFGIHPPASWGLLEPSVS